MMKGTIAALLLQRKDFMAMLMRVLVRVSVIVAMAVAMTMIVAWMSVTKRCEAHDVYDQPQNADDEQLI